MSYFRAAPSHFLSKSRIASREDVALSLLLAPTIMRPWKVGDSALQACNRAFLAAWASGGGLRKQIRIEYNVQGCAGTHTAPPERRVADDWVGIVQMYQLFLPLLRWMLRTVFGIGMMDAVWILQKMAPKSIIV